jgi:hypothetical protein
MAEFVTSLIIAFISATIMAALGWAKNRPTEAFQPEKLFSTYVAAFFIAILFVAWDIPTETGEQLFWFLLDQTGFIVALERFLKFFWRTYIEPPPKPTPPPPVT